MYRLRYRLMSKRTAKGEGSVYQRKDGKWCAQLNGQYRYSTTEDGAKAKLYQMLAGVEETKPQNITVATLMDKWFDYQAPNLKPSTIKRYREAIQIYVKPNLGHHKLHTLTAFQVQSLYSKMLKQGLSATTVNLVHSVLSSSFKRAIKWRMVEYNIISNVEAPRIHRKEVEVFSPQEVQALLYAASQNRLEAVYVLALSTGMRGGEILALQPQDFDAASDTLVIRRTLIMNGSAVGTPKSKNSRRTIQLPSIAIEAIERQLHKIDKNSMCLFPGRTGQNLRYHSFITFQSKPLVERAGIEYKSFHTCRHYVASELLGRGVPVTAVARYVGDTETTLLSTYRHLIRGMEHLVPTAMDNMLADRDIRHL